MILSFKWDYLQIYMQNCKKGEYNFTEKLKNRTSHVVFVLHDVKLVHKEVCVYIFIFK